VATAQIGDRALDRRQDLVLGDRQAVLGQRSRDRAGTDVAAVGEQHQRSPGGADPLEHLDRARLRVGAAVGISVHERPIDVEHEPAYVVEPQLRARRPAPGRPSRLAPDHGLASVDARECRSLVNHGARAPFRRP